VEWVSEAWGNLVEVGRDVALLLNHAGPDLGDVHVDHKAVVAIDLEQFVLGQILGVDVVLDVHMFVGQDYVRVSERVTWGLNVEYLEVLVHLLLVHLEVVITPRSNLAKSVRCQGLGLLLGKLLLKPCQSELLLDELVDFRLDLGDFIVVRWVCLGQVSEVSLSSFGIV